MTAQELQSFLHEHGLDDNGAIQVERAGAGSARVRLTVSGRHLRPGETVSGVAMMALADVAMYVALLATIGSVPLAVTTSLNINFLRKPPNRDLIAEVKLLKLGKRLAVGEIALQSEAQAEPVAHATSTYSIPGRTGQN